MKIRTCSKSDYSTLVRFIEELQDYIVATDPLKRLRRLPAYGKSYTNNLLKEIKRSKGVIYLAEDNGKLVGVVAGEIKKQTKENILECIPTKQGCIKELYVSNDYRSQGLGKVLMDKIEDYFKKNKCTVITLAVLSTNPAYEFYKRMGYKDRSIDVIKVLK